MITSELIFTHKYIKYIWENGIHTPQNRRKNIGVILHITVVVAIIMLFNDDFMMTKALNLSNWKYKTAYLN